MASARARVAFISVLLAVLTLICRSVIDVSAQATPPPAPNTVSYLAGAVSIGWERAGDLVWFTLSAPLSASSYFSVATTANGAFKMAGGIGFACNQPASGSTVTTCQALSLSNYGSSTRSDDPEFGLVQAGTTATHAWVKVKVTASKMGITTTSAQRTIFAVGPWSGGVTAHSDRGSTSIAYTDSATLVPSAAPPTTAAPTPVPTAAPTEAPTPALPGPTATPTTTLAPTAIPTPAPTVAPTSSSSSSSPPPSSSLSGLLSNSLDITVDSWLDDKLTLVLRTPTASSSTNSEYVAVCIAASGMTGAGVACVVPVAGASSATCVAISTTDYNAASRSEPDLTVVSVTQVGGTHSSIKVALAASLVGLSGASPVTKRLIYARGGWSTASALPMQHGGGTANRASSSMLFTQTTTPGATPVPMPPPTVATTAAGGTGTKSNGSIEVAGVKIAWIPIGASSANVTLTLTSADGLDNYAAIAWSASGMTGAGVACSLLSSGAAAAAAAAAVCTDIDLVNYRIAARAKTLTHVLASKTTSSGGWEMQITFPLSNFNIAASSTSSSSRVIVAHGAWDKANNLPLRHGAGASARAAASIDLSSGGSSSPSGIEVDSGWRFPLALSVTFVWALLCASLGSVPAIREWSLRLSQGGALALRVAVVGSLLASFAGNVIAAHADKVAAKASLPLARAFGNGLFYPFSLLLLPTQKYFALGKLAGSSFERFIAWHVLSGVMIVVMSTVHMTMMVVDGFDGDFFKMLDPRNGLKNPPLPAFTGYIFLIVMAVSGLARRKYYTFFRYFHFVSFCVVVVAFIIHAPTLGIALSIGLMCWTVDTCMRLFGDPTVAVTLVEYNAAAKVTLIQLEIPSSYPTPGPGQFLLLTLPTISALPHPFSIAHTSLKTRQVTLMIKALGPYTTAVACSAAAAAIKEAKISRPLGQLGLALSSPAASEDPLKAVVCAMAGIGITVGTSILQHMVTTSSSSTASGAPLLLPSRVQLVWSVRESELIVMVMPLLEEILAASSGGSGKTTTFQVTIHHTGDKNKKPLTAPLMASSRAATNHDQELDDLLFGHGNSSNSTATSSASKIKRNHDPRITILSGRPKWGDVLNKSKMKLSASDRVHVFSCGPAPFMTEVSSAATANNCHLHEETFEL